MGSILSDNDERFISIAGTFSDAEWSRPSLCTEWTNHEVLAHLVHGCSASLVRFGARMGATRGFDGANTSLARELAARRTPTELLDDLRGLRDNRRGLGRVLPKKLLLGDHVVHELDIVFALGRPPTVAPDALAAVLDTEVKVPNPFVPARRHAQGLALHATDIHWTRAGRPDRTVAGTGADLASVLAGRPHALPRLTGSGVALLAQRLSHIARSV